MQRANQTLNGLPSSGHGRLGIARVTIPKNADRDEYVRKSLSSCSVALRDPYSGQIVEMQAHVPINLMSYIRFPEENVQEGSLVSYKVVDKRLIFVVDGVLVATDEGSSLEEEGEHFLEAKNSVLRLSSSYALVSSYGEEATPLIQAVGKNALLQLISGGTFELKVKVDDDNTLASLTFDGKVWKLLRFNDESKAEPALLGDKTLEELNSIIDEIKAIADADAQITIPSPFGPLGPPINSARFVAISSKLDVIKNGIDKILSKNLKID